ncbi:hypothetical protein [Kurthia sibirica]|uniref:hypothetical protein n=1 Tax=Kurthia sibirica TaxID=202750 RepID=UPI00116DFF62|nr:hypothetical protein [Kurthia sibirica]GEK34894.1 hypothetical protein KSI01_24270 [Kurthia sibirica]
MTVAWLAILPVVFITIGFASYLVYFVIRNNNHSHKYIDAKPNDTNHVPKKEEL